MVVKIYWKNKHSLLVSTWQFFYQHPKIGPNSTPRIKLTMRLISMVYCCYLNSMAKNLFPKLHPMPDHVLLIILVRCLKLFQPFETKIQHSVSLFKLIKNNKAGEISFQWFCNNVCLVLTYSQCRYHFQYWKANICKDPNCGGTLVFDYPYGNINWKDHV